MQRLGDDPRGEDLLDRGLLLVHGVGIRRPVATVLDDHPCQVALGDAGREAQPLGPQGEERRRGGEAGLLLPRLEERRADDPLGHLLRAEHEDGVVLPGPDGGRREHQGGAAAGAARLDVDDRHARHAEPAKHLVAGRHAAVGGAAERSLEAALADARLSQRGADGDHTHVGGRGVEAPERVHADTGDGDGGRGRAHDGAKAYVTTSFPSESACSATRRNSIACPAWRAAGSLSVRRVMTRTPSGSSTTPTPNGTSPS